MTIEERAKIKAKIIKDLEFVHHEIDDLQDKTAPIAPDCSLGRLTRQEMIQEQQVAEHALHEAEIRLNKLTFALSKVDSESFGLCMECEDDIPIERLKLVPESVYCMECAREKSL